MLPTPRAGWVIPLSFDKKTEEGYVASADKWNGVEKFVLSEESAPPSIKVDKRYHLQTTGSGGIVYVQNYSPGRNDQLLPSGSLTVKISDRSGKEYSSASLDTFPFVDSIRIYGDAPAKVIKVPVDAVVPLDSFAISDISHYTWPDDGDVIKAFSNQGQQTVRCLDYDYEFFINESSPVTSIADVEVYYEDDRLLGQIVDYEVKEPDRGDVIEAKIDYSQAEDIAWWGEHDDRIKLDQTLPVSGTAKIQITQPEHPLQGSVVEYPSEIPQVGDTVVGYATNKDAEYVKSQDFDGRIYVPNGADQAGYVDVQITDMDGTLSGKIVSYRASSEQGDVVRAQVSQGRSPVTGTIVGTGTKVRIKENVLASGTVDVRLLNDTHPYTAEIVSYNGLLPETGETVQASVETAVTISTAHPDRGSYVIYIQNDDGYEGRALVRITDVEDRISGEIVETSSVSQSPQQDSTTTPFDSESSAWNITRKKR